MTPAAIASAPARDNGSTRKRMIPVTLKGPARASWTGILKLGLVTIPVKAYPMIGAKDEVELHQLHAGCGQRIRLPRHCPVHGPVDAKDIVKGFEHRPDQHVILDSTDLEKVRPTDDRVAHLDHFLPGGAIDPALFAGKALVLLPDGLMAHRPYAVLAEVLHAGGKWALGRAALAGRRSGIAVRPVGHGLALDVLHDPTRRCDLAAAGLTAVEVGAEELGLARRLVEAHDGEVCWSDYRDDSAERLAALIEAKLQGRELPARRPEGTPVLPLAEALTRSLALRRKPPKGLKSRTTRHARTQPSGK